MWRREANRLLTLLYYGRSHWGVLMPSPSGRPVKELLALEAEAQQVLDELWAEETLPFKLSVGKLTESTGHYTIHFYDSRIRTADVRLTDGSSFQEMVRAAVLKRVAEMGAEG